MWLLAGQKAPDHSTIARFRTGFLADACENLFYQMVKRLEDAGELSKETVFIDGTKLEVCVAFKQGISAKLLGFARNKDAGSAGHGSVFGRSMPDREYGFCSWAWKTEKQKSTVF